jgi:hypothetical protein
MVEHLLKHGCNHSDADTGEEPRVLCTSGRKNIIHYKEKLIFGGFESASELYRSSDRRRSAKRIEGVAWSAQRVDIACYFVGYVCIEIVVVSHLKGHNSIVAKDPCPHSIVDASILQLSHYGIYVDDGSVRKKSWLNSTVFCFM